MNGMDGVKENTGFTVPLYERSFGTDVSGEFTLPDYQSEIRRILHVFCTVLPPAKYVGDSSVEFNGTVDYQVLYVGSDGGMYSAPLSSAYSFSVTPENADYSENMDGVSVLCSIAVEGVNTRVSAPRRLSIKCRMRPNVRIYGRILPALRIGDEVPPSSIYKRNESCTSVECESTSSDIITVEAGTVQENDAIRVICADTSVRVTGRELTQNGISCSGTVVFNLLCVNEDSGELLKLETEAPFEGDIDAEFSVSDGVCRVSGVTSELSVNVGEEGIECTAGIILEAVICRNVQVDYIADVYSTAAECECETRQMKVRSSLVCETSNFTLSERVPTESVSIPEDAQILDGFAAVRIDKCCVSSGKYCFGGNAVFTVIYVSNGETYSADVTVPVKYCSGTAEFEPAAFDATVRIDTLRLKIADGNLCIDAELMISADCMSENTVYAVSGASFGDSIDIGDRELTVCYTSPEDTLWSVAKKYKAAPASVIGNPETDRYVIIE